ncbi:MAG TPA: Rieske (2Fe-2S) protein [Candidatus Dormibacteraeota bacterium]|jgi:nitrite reductase/ring-hydroxylating ferredoxin subunit|nr:Rieske (2Fe-2S) protein [Candidatus Dormibacteraeota bacterium]
MKGRGGRRFGRYVDALIRDRKPPAGPQDPEDLQALAAAIDLSASRPQAGLPDPQFVARLEARLRERAGGDVRPLMGISRRGLLQAGGLAAAAAAVGAVGEHVVAERGSGAPERQDITAEGGTWTAVAAADAVPASGGLRFKAGAIEGVVVNRGGEMTALMAVCTHLGCILELDGDRRQLHCPCGQAVFGLGGEVVVQGRYGALRPLPRIPTRVRDGMVEVRVV